jgi:hypothetical protein
MIQDDLSNILPVPNSNNNADRFVMMTNRTHGPKTLGGLIKEMQSYKRNVPMSQYNTSRLNRYIKMAQEREKAGIRLSDISNKIKRVFRRK